MFQKFIKTNKTCLVSTRETKLQARKSSLKTDQAPVKPPGTLDQNNCMLKTWSLRVEKRSKPPCQRSIQTPAKGRKIKTKKWRRGQFKRQKMLTKSHWKCTHRAGVKCCNKNVIWLKIQYGGASRTAVPFSLDLCLQFCHVTDSAPASSNKRPVLNSWWCWMLS